MGFQKVVKINGRRAKSVECKCDQCGLIFQKRYSILYTNLEKLTFCCMECRASSSRKNGKVNQKFEETCLKKYGTKSPAQSSIIQEKMKKTFKQNYGVENPYQSKNIKEKIQQTCLKKYGVDHVMKSDEIKEKIKETCIEKYGVDHQWKSKSIREKASKISIKKYGTRHPTQSSIIKKKIEKTCIEKYGVKNPSQDENVKKKKIETCLKNYNVEYPLKSKEIKSKIDWKLSVQKSHETMKKNGTYGKSRTEDRFFDSLCKKFGKENVERQVRINEWNIDFHIKSIKTYIQFDGVYWHGLDRPIEVIKEFKNSRDRVIYKTSLRDQEQNKWFKKNNLKLIRVTDNQFNQI